MQFGKSDTLCIIYTHVYYYTYTYTCICTHILFSYLNCMINYFECICKVLQKSPHSISDYIITLLVVTLLFLPVTYPSQAQILCTFSIVLPNLNILMNSMIQHEFFCNCFLLLFSKFIFVFVYILYYLIFIYRYISSLLISIF